MTSCLLESPSRGVSQGWHLDSVRQPFVMLLLLPMGLDVLLISRARSAYSMLVMPKMVSYLRPAIGWAAEFGRTKI